MATALSHVDPEVLLLARLEVAREIHEHYARASETFWVASIGAGAAGVIGAVASGNRARHWEQTVRELEHELLVLRLERRLQRVLAE